MVFDNWVGLAPSQGAAAEVCRRSTHCIGFMWLPLGTMGYCFLAYERKNLPEEKPANWAAFSLDQGVPIHT